MDVAANAIAGLALLFVVAGYITTRRQIRQEQVDRKRDREEREREREADQKATDKELAMLFESIKGAEGERAANLEVTLGEHAEHPTMAFHTFEVELVNGGPGLARQVSVWAIGKDGTKESTGRVRLPPLAAKDSSNLFTLTVPFAVIKRPISLRVAWEDGKGPHEETLGTLW